jgi:hypothetical protein
MVVREVNNQGANMKPDQEAFDAKTDRADPAICHVSGSAKRRTRLRSQWTDSGSSTMVELASS